MNDVQNVIHNQEECFSKFVNEDQKRIYGLGSGS